MFKEYFLTYIISSSHILPPPTYQLTSDNWTDSYNLSILSSPPKFKRIKQQLHNGVIRNSALPPSTRLRCTLLLTNARKYLKSLTSSSTLVSIASVSTDHYHDCTLIILWSALLVLLTIFCMLLIIYNFLLPSHLPTVPSQPNSDLPPQNRVSNRISVSNATSSFIK